MSATGLADSSAENVTLSWLQLTISVLAIVVPLWWGIYVYRKDHPRDGVERGRERAERVVPVWAWVLVVIVLVGLLGIGGLVYFFNRSPVIHDAASTPSPHPTSTHPVGARTVAVSNIYNLPEARALHDLVTQGFRHVRVERVCSNSVPGGRVRQVILDNGKPLGHEDEVVGEAGSASRPLPPSTPLVVKVSNGQQC